MPERGAGNGPRIAVRNRHALSPLLHKGGVHQRCKTGERRKEKAETKRLVRECQPPDRLH